MAATQRDQALQRKRTTSYGANPGEITEGMKPGDRVFDPDTNTWQLRPQAEGTPIGDYLDVIMGASGLQGGPSVQAQAPIPATRGSTTGNSADDISEGTNPDPNSGDPSTKVQEGLNEGLPLEEIAAGVLGASAAGIAVRMLAQRKKRGGSPAGGQPDPTGSSLVPGQLSPKGGQVIDGTFDEILGIESPRQALPAPVNSDGSVPDMVVPQGTQDSSQLNNLIEDTMYGELSPDEERRAMTMAQILQANANKGQVNQVNAFLADPANSALKARIMRIMGMQL